MWTALEDGVRFLNAYIKSQTSRLTCQFQILVRIRSLKFYIFVNMHIVKLMSKIKCCVLLFLISSSYSSSAQFSSYCNSRFA